MGANSYVVKALAALFLGSAAISFAQTGSNDDSAANLSIAQYTAADELVLPADIDRWIVLGTNLGGNYEAGAFDPENPGQIGVVQMEPQAYNYFLENRRYANGTMLLLSFYRTQVKPEPELRGFVQGDLAAREMHVIDRDKYPGDRAFYLYPAGGPEASARLAPDDVCVECHAEHGDFDSTFIQFYPTIRHLISESE